MAATNIRRDIGGKTLILENGAVAIDKQHLADQLDEYKEARIALTHGSPDWYPEQWLPEVAKREQNDDAA